MWCFSVCLLYIIFTLSLIDLEATGIEKNIFSVKYKTYTKDNPNKEVELRDVKNFNDGMKTKFVIHGWLSIPLDEGIKVKDATFKWQHDVGRVVLVDWRGLNSNPIYNDVVKKTVPEIAEDLTKELIYVQNKGNGKIELVGHSLGAHIAGQAGRLFKLNTGKKIDSIIALDPAGPWFKKSENRDKVMKCTDAKKVQVIHTNTDIYGYPDKICPDDLFPNGGRIQPECDKGLNILIRHLCSHNAAYDRYLDQIENKTVIEYPKSQRYVLCLDISPSMLVNNRLDRVQGSAKQVIASMKNGSYLGIVSFGGYAQINHPIVKIKGKKERDSLISSIPSNTIPHTCIKEGLETSKKLLKQSTGNDKLRLSIILITDGQEDCTKTASDAIHELVKAGNTQLGSKIIDIFTK